MQVMRKAFFCLFLFLGSGSCFGSSPAVAQVSRGGALRVEALPEDLRELEIKDFFVPALAKQVGVIHALRGHVVVVHRGADEAYFGREGDLIYEADSITTFADSKCRIKFYNDDVVTMAPETNFGVDRFEDQRKIGRKRSFFSMMKGKAMFYALRLFKYRESNFKVKTPTSVIGVRGTKFGAHVYWVEEEIASGPGIRVADRHNGMGQYLAQVETGGERESYTDCFSEDGYVEVNGNLLSPGEMYTGKTGTVIPTPPEVVRAFEQETEVENEGGNPKHEGSPGSEENGEDQEESEESAALTPSGSRADPGAVADITENSAAAVQQEAIQRAEDALVGSIEIAKGKTAGEVSAIAAIVAFGWDGQAYFAPGKSPIYLSHDENDLQGGAETHHAQELWHTHGEPGAEDFKLVAVETDEAPSAITVQYFDWGTGGDISIDPPRDFKYFRGGTYEEGGQKYLEWGWWEDDSFPAPAERGKIAFDGNDFYAASKKIWHIEGERTHPDYISYLHEQGAIYDYKGEAKGVYARSGAADVADLSGDFHCNVNFGTKQVSDFYIDAGGGGHGVTLVGGSGKVACDGSFDISGFGVQFDGAGVPAPDAGASGGFAGGKAQGVGGVWWAHDAADKWATGEFHGKR